MKKYRKYRTYNTTSSRNLRYQQFDRPTDSKQFLAETLRLQAAVAEAELPEIRERFRKLIHAFDPEIALATTAFHSSFTTIDHQQNIADQISPVWQHHVELLQAHYLTLQDVEKSKAFPHARDIHELGMCVVDYAELFFYASNPNNVDELGKSELFEQMIIQTMRFHTLVIRQWGHLEHVFDICRRLFSKINPVLSELHGLTAEQILSFFRYIIEEIHRKANARMNAILGFYREKKIPRVVEKYYANFEMEGDPRSFLNLVEARSYTRQEVLMLLLSHQSLTLSRVFTINLSEASNTLQIELPLLLSLAHHVGYQFGELKGQDAQNFPYANPVLQRPLILYAGSNTVFCPIPALFSNSAFRIFENLINTKPKALEKLSREVRSKFLEEEVQTAFAGAFTRAALEANFKWDVYETDFLILIDVHLFIVESKSHKASAAGLRGSLKSAKDYVHKVFLEPSLQSERLRNRILEAMGNRDSVSTLLPDFKFDLGSIKEVHRLSVALEDFGFLQSNLHTVVQAGWIPSDHQIAPTLLLSDLRIIFDILETPATRIDYLIKRTKLPNNFAWLGDEIDILGYYLTTGLNERLPDQARLVLDSTAKPISDYYEVSHYGIPAKKPKLRLTPYWERLCAHLEKRDLKGWSVATEIALSVPFELQEKALKKFERIKQNVRKHWRDEKHTCSVIIGRPDGPFAMILHAVNDNTAPGRHAVMQHLATQALQNNGAEAVLVITIDINRREIPYATMAVFT